METAKQFDVAVANNWGSECSRSGAKSEEDAETWFTFFE